jgi:hypothetical protein
MKKNLVFFAIFLASSSASQATSHAQSALIGTWKNLNCHASADGTRSMAYHVKFEANGQLSTYLQYYKAPGCQGSIDSATQQSRGTYELLNSTELNGALHGELILHHPQMNYLRAQRVNVHGGVLQMCPGTQPGTCAYFNKIA